jgi:hypothetical protein
MPTTTSSSSSSSSSHVNNDDTDKYFFKILSRSKIDPSSELQTIFARNMIDD